MTSSNILAELAQHPTPGLRSDHEARQARLSRMAGVHQEPGSSTVSTPAGIALVRATREKSRPSDKEIGNEALHSEILPFQRRDTPLRLETLLGALCTRRGLPAKSMSERPLSESARFVCASACFLARHYANPDVYTLGITLMGKGRSSTDEVDLIETLIFTDPDLASDIALVEHMLGLVPWGERPDRMTDTAPYPSRMFVSLAEIRKAACLEFGVMRVDFMSPRRGRNVVSTRFAAFFIAKRHTTKSLPEIGRFFGGKDHATVLHGIRKAEQLIRDDEEFAASVARIKRTLGLE